MFVFAEEAPNRLAEDQSYIAIFLRAMTINPRPKPKSANAEGSGVGVINESEEPEDSGMDGKLIVGSSRVIVVGRLGPEKVWLGGSEIVVVKSAGTVGVLAIIKAPSPGGVSFPGLLFIFHTMTPCPKELAQAKTIAITMNDAFIYFE
jgi:hypothetical protein